MQLELTPACGAAPAASPQRVLAVYVPDLPLQRVLCAREERGPPSREARAPVAIERDGTILCCDAEARARGIRPGDALLQARAACGDVVVFTVDEEADRALLESLAEAMLSIAPTVEIAWPDTLLLDASGARLFGADVEGETALADRAVSLARELGLRCRVAIAAGRSPARALARHGGSEPAGRDTASVAAALARLPVEALGLEPEITARLVALGFREAAHLARVPVETLAHRLGAAGIAAWRLARGEDPSPLVPYVPVRLPEEALELEGTIESTEPLLFALKRLSDRVSMRLAGRRLGATRLAVTLTLDGADAARFEIALAAPSASSSRWLLVARERLASLRLGAPIVAVRLAVAEAAPAVAEQLAIEDRPEQLVALETVLARITARLGDAALFTARPADRYRPEAAYGTTAFAAGTAAERRRAAGPRPGRGRRRERANGHGGADPGASPPPDHDGAIAVRPSRLLPRPELLVVLGEGGRVTAVRIRGKTLRVVAVSAAERLAGEWWSDPFDRDYHRVRIEGLGDCWVYRDARDGRLWLHGFFD